MESSITDNGAINLHKNQIDGFERWKCRRKYKDSLKGKWKADNKLLELIKKKYASDPKLPGKYRVSSSSLQPYFQCSLKWLFERVLAIGNVQMEANLMGENVAGMAYHAALNLFFSKIMESNEALKKPNYSDRGQPSLPDDYRELLKESVDEIFDKFPLIDPSKNLQMSSLTARLLRAGKRNFLFNMENCIANFLSLFCGCTVAGCETVLETERDTFFLNGKLDCILEAPPEEGVPKKHIIIDFKMGNPPKRADCTVGEDSLSDFQLPMYITLAEEKNKIEVHTALFYSILFHSPEVIIGTVQDVNTKVVIPKKEDERILYKSEMYNLLFEEFNKKTRQFADEISSGDFSVFESEYSECKACGYNRMCRTVYVINREIFF